MSTNLNYKLNTEFTVSELRDLLLDKSAISKIFALSFIDYSNCNELINEIKLCGYDFRPLVRANAYKALKYAEKKSVIGMLQDALRDSNRDAYQAAVELFDAMKKA